MCTQNNSEENTVSYSKRFRNAIVYEDMHNSWLYCFTNPLEIDLNVTLKKLSRKKIFFVTVKKLWCDFSYEHLNYLFVKTFLNNIYI